MGSGFSASCGFGFMSDDFWGWFLFLVVVLWALEVLGFKLRGLGIMGSGFSPRRGFGFMSDDFWGCSLCWEGV